MCGIERWNGLSALGDVAENSWGVAPGWDRDGALPLNSDAPLAEQRRIVAKVEQLMALVDALETQLAAARATAANLLSALVAELTGTPGGPNVAASAASGTGRRGRPPKSR